MEENRNETIETLEEIAVNEPEVEETEYLPAEIEDEDCNAGVGTGFAAGLAVAAVGYGLYKGGKFAWNKFQDWREDRKSKKGKKEEDQEQPIEVRAEIVEEVPKTDKKKK